MGESRNHSEGGGEGARMKFGGESGRGSVDRNRRR